MKLLLLFTCVAASTKEPATSAERFAERFVALNSNGYLDLSGFKVEKFTEEQRKAFIINSNKMVEDLKKRNSRPGKLWAPINYWAQGWIEVSTKRPLDSLDRGSAVLEPKPLPNPASTNILSQQYRDYNQVIAHQDDRGHVALTNIHNLHVNPQVKRKVTFAADNYVKTFDNSLEPATIKAAPVNQAKLSDGASSDDVLMSNLKIGENTNPYVGLTAEPVPHTEQQQPLPNQASSNILSQQKPDYKRTIEPQGYRGQSKLTDTTAQKSTGPQTAIPVHTTAPKPLPVGQTLPQKVAALSQAKGGSSASIPATGVASVNAIRNTIYQFSQRYNTPDYEPSLLLLKKLLQANLAILKVSMAGCRPCEIIKEPFNRLSTQYADHATFFSFQNDYFPHLVEFLKLASFPSAIVFTNGVAGAVENPTSEQAITKLVEKAVGVATKPKAPTPQTTAPKPLVPATTSPDVVNSQASVNTSTLKDFDAQCPPSQSDCKPSRFLLSDILQQPLAILKFSRSYGCPPCDRIKEPFERLSEQYASQASFYPREPTDFMELFHFLNLKSVPSVIVYRYGVRGYVHHPRTADAITTLVKSALALTQ